MPRTPPILEPEAVRGATSPSWRGTPRVFICELEKPELLKSDDARSLGRVVCKASGDGNGPTEIRKYVGRGALLGGAVRANPRTPLRDDAVRRRAPCRSRAGKTACREPGPVPAPGPVPGSAPGSAPGTGLRHRSIELHCIAWPRRHGSAFRTCPHPEGGRQGGIRQRVRGPCRTEGRLARRAPVTGGMPTLQAAPCLCCVGAAHTVTAQFDVVRRRQ